jgi:hypothetical protein
VGLRVENGPRGVGKNTLFEGVVRKHGVFGSDQGTTCLNVFGVTLYVCLGIMGSRPRDSKTELGRVIRRHVLANAPSVVFVTR